MKKESFYSEIKRTCGYLYARHLKNYTTLDSVIMYNKLRKDFIKEFLK